MTKQKKRKRRQETREGIQQPIPKKINIILHDSLLEKDVVSEECCALDHDDTVGDSCAEYDGQGQPVNDEEPETAVLGLSNQGLHN